MCIHIYTFTHICRHNQCSFWKFWDFQNSFISARTRACSEYQDAPLGNIRMHTLMCLTEYLSVHHIVNPRRCETSLVGRSSGLSVPKSPVRFQQKLQKSKPQNLYLNTYSFEQSYLNISYEVRKTTSINMYDLHVQKSCL